MQSLQTCPVCRGLAAREFLARPNVPVHQHSLMPTRAQARAVRRGTLTMHSCGDCGFVFNGTFDSTLLDYNQEYDNNQTCSAAFELHLEDRARRVLEVCEAGRNIIEIGCGQGQFLHKLLQLSDSGTQAVGFDPSYAADGPDFNKRLRFQREFFPPPNYKAQAEAVVCRHVIEHIGEPVEFLASLQNSLDGSQAPVRLFFETPCLEWILRNRVFWDLFYEHCSLFNRESLALAFETAGFRVDSIEHVFGGQYLWLEAVLESTPHSPVARRNGGLDRLAEEFGEQEHEQTSLWRATVGRLNERGAVALWGAGAKGVTLANLIDPQADRLACVVDLNPRKQGCFLPGSGHPIVAPRQLDSLGVQSVIVLNENYTTEIRQLVRQLGLNVQVVTPSDTEFVDARNVDSRDSDANAQMTSTLR